MLGMTYDYSLAFTVELFRVTRLLSSVLRGKKLCGL